VACRRCGGTRGRGHPCWPSDAPISRTIAVYDYRGPVTAGVVAAKVGGAWAAWRPMAALLVERVLRDRPEVDVVTWVTTPVARVRQRGIDHAEVLARAVAAALHTPVVRLLDASEDGVEHDRYEARIALPGSQVLLVDDVVTTGTTAVRAATALRRAGADEVALAVLARAGSHPLTGAMS
jgi:predicted amidophosphoribosyltransferase